MTTERTRMGMPLSITLGVFLVGMSFVNVPRSYAEEDYGRALRLTISADRQMFECGEAVPLTLKVTNDSETTICLGMLALWEPYIELTSAAGELIHVPIPDPNTPPPGHYFMERNGKRVYTVPVLKIDGGKTVSETIPDAIKHHHRYVSAGGVYHLKAKMISALYNESEVFRRADYPDEFWVEPKGGVLQVELVSNSIKIEIRERNLFPWAFLLGAVLIGAAVLGVVVILRKKAIIVRGQP